MIKENSDKGKCKNVTDTLVKHANYLPLNHRKIKSMEDEIQRQPIKDLKDNPLTPPASSKYNANSENPPLVTNP
eukprot:jgi/Orpsp1_1/1177297/evm.model.c7180000060868.1